MKDRTPLEDVTPTIRAIAGLTAALVAQDTAYTETARQRRQLIRQAMTEGASAATIAAGTGITRQRVQQLATEGTGQ